jgi:LPXTG-motif cell wall-anchored protein
MILLYSETAVSGASAVVVVGAGLLIYFKKRKR